MTTYAKKSVVCGCCGAVFTHHVLTSTNTFGGSMDLDTRPPEMMRSTMDAWVQVCPQCGFAAVDASKADADTRKLVQDPSYQAIRNNRDYPELARAFLCCAWIAQHKGDVCATAWSFLHAAWVCDDANKPLLASTCREQAVAQIRTALQRGLRISDQEGATECILVDCLRRTGKFEEANDLVAARLKCETTPVIRQVLAFQKKLLQQHDVACHTLEEALR